MVRLNTFAYATCALCFLLAAPASAIIIPLPPADCTLRDDTEVRFHAVDAEDISLVMTYGEDTTVVLGFPETRRGLTIDGISSPYNTSVVEQLQTMIASAETFTLSDVAASFDQDQYVTEIGYLSPDLVRCMTKDN